MAKDAMKRRELPAGGLSAFCTQVGMAIDSGMPLYEGMETVAAGQQDAAFAAVCSRVSENVTATGSLADALKNDPAFPAFVASMAHVGERTGRLGEVMKGLGAYYEREERMQKAAVSAVAYPMVLGVIMLLIIVAMLTLVMPVFRQVLGSMGVTADNASMRAGTALGWTVLIVVSLVMFTVLACVVLSKTPVGAKFWKLIRRIVPSVGRLGARRSASRAASVMAVMLTGGCTMDETMDAVVDVLGNTPERACAQDLKKRVDSGESFGDALAACGLFDGLHAGMLRSGGRLGDIEGAMQRVARELSQSVEDGVMQLVSIVEPTLVVALTVAVGAMLMSVMLPMLSLVFSII